MRNFPRRASQNAIGTLSVILICLLSLTSRAQLLNRQSFTYEGVMQDTSGNPVSLVNKVVEFSIWSPTGNCAIYTERLSPAGDASGNISHRIGQGFPVAGSYSDSLFNSAITVNSCSMTASEDRVLRLVIYDGATVLMTATVPITSVPYAIESQSLAGYKPNQFLRVENAGIPAAAPALDSTQANNLMRLLTGATGVDLSQASTVFTSAPRWSGDVSLGGSDTLANKAYVDSKISAGLPVIGSSGTYTKVNIDTQGRVVSGSLLNSSDVPNLDASKITSGLLTVNQGGTGASSFGFNSVVVSNATGSALSSLNCSFGKVIKFDVSGFAACGDDNGQVTSLSSGNSYLSVSNSSTTPIVTANVGTTTNTLAAGDDPRILGALQRSGGTMSGLLDMGGQSILNSGSISLNSSQFLGLGLYSADPSGGWSAANRGRVWYDVSANEVRFFNGASSRALMSTAQVFSGDLSGTAANMSVDRIKNTPVTISSLSTGQVLRYNGSGWTNSVLSLSDPSIGVLSAANGGTGISSFAAGDLIYASNPTTLSRISIGASGTFLMSNGASSPPTWASSLSVFTNGGNTFSSPAVLGTNDFNDLVFRTNGSNRMTLSSAGNLGIGTTAPVLNLDVTGQFGIKPSGSGYPNSLAQGFNGRFFAVHTASDWGFVVTRAANDSGWANLALYHTRNTDASQMATLTGGDGLGRITFQGPTSPSSVNIGAQIHASVSGAVTATNLPTDLVFSTAQTGNADLSNNERMRITASGNIGVGTAIPSTFALLDLSSTNRGLLIPRLTMTQRTASLPAPTGAQGLQIYNTTTNTLNLYNGTGWVDLISNNGNSLGGLPMTLGTNDSQPLNLETAGTNRMTVTSTGQVGIGTSTPTNELTVNGVITSVPKFYNFPGVATSVTQDISLDLSNTHIIKFTSSQTGSLDIRFRNPMTEGATYTILIVNKGGAPQDQVDATVANHNCTPVMLGAAPTAATYYRILVTPVYTGSSWICLYRY